MNLQLRVEKPTGFFGSANTLGRRFPSDDIITISGNNRGAANFCSCMMIKNLRDEIRILVLSVWGPKIRDIIRQMRHSNWKINVRVNFFPNGTPGCGPNARVPFVNLNNAVINQFILDLNYRGSESRFCRNIAGQPKASIVKIFSFENIREKFVLTSCYIPGCMKNETAIDCAQITDT